MSNRFATFVINLEAATDRKKQMSQQLIDVGLQFEIVSAINGKSLTAEQVAAVYDASGARALQNRPLSLGEIGCALSHIWIFREIISRNLSAALVLEDDARLVAGFQKIVQPLVEIIAEERQPTVYLLTHLMRYKKRVYLEVDDAHNLHKVVDACCTHGYLINQAAARRMMDFFTPIRCPIDAWPRVAAEKHIQVLGINPYVIGHSDLAKESNIEVGRDEIGGEFQPNGIEKLRFYMRFYLYEKFVYQIWKLLVGIKKQRKQSWDLG